MATSPGSRTYSRDPETGSGYFDEVVEPENPLVSSEQAQLHVEAMREHGMSYRQIAGRPV